MCLTYTKGGTSAWMKISVQYTNLMTPKHHFNLPGLVFPLQWPFIQTLCSSLTLRPPANVLWRHYLHVRAHATFILIEVWRGDATVPFFALLQPFIACGTKHGALSWRVVQEGRCYYGCCQLLRCCLEKEQRCGFTWRDYSGGIIFSHLFESFIFLFFWLLFTFLVVIISDLFFRVFFLNYCDTWKYIKKSVNSPEAAGGLLLVTHATTLHVAHILPSTVPSQHRVWCVLTIHCVSQKIGKKTNWKKQGRK